MASIGPFTIMTGCAILFCIISLQASAAQVPYGRTYDLTEDAIPDSKVMPRKRPFCNAFTGCQGRKRSYLPQQQLLPDAAKSAYQKMALDDSIESLLDLSSEPAVEELSRQMMSEAKLWEALQEAGAELSRRRQFDSPYSAQ